MLYILYLHLRVCVCVKGVVSKYLERVFCLDFVVHHLWILFIFVYRFVVCWFFVQIGVCRFVCLCGRCLCRALVSLVNRGWPGGQYIHRSHWGGHQLWSLGLTRMDRLQIYIRQRIRNEWWWLRIAASSIRRVA